MNQIVDAEVNFTKLFHVTLDLICVYNIIMLISGQSLEKQARFGASKIKKMKSDYRKLTNLYLVGLIFSDIAKETLLTTIGFILK